MKVAVYPKLTDVVRKKVQIVTRKIFDFIMTSKWRPLKNIPFCTIPASGSNFNPRNTQCMSACPVGPADRTEVVKIFVFSRSKSGIFDLALNKIKYFSKVSGYRINPLPTPEATEQADLHRLLFSFDY